MPRLDLRTCKGCRRHSSEVGDLSWTGLCGTCGISRLASNITQMHERRGPNWNLWRRNMALSVGGLLLDDLANPVQSDGHAR